MRAWSMGTQKDDILPMDVLLRAITLWDTWLLATPMCNILLAKTY